MLYNEDCFEFFKRIEDGSVDLVLADPPYGATKCKWDTPIPFEPLWRELNRILKPNGVVCLFGCEPFSSALRMSNIKAFKYDWYWHKTTATNFLNARRQPLRNVETVSVFYRKQPYFNPQKTQGHERKVSLAKHKLNSKKSEAYGDHGATSYDSTERFPTQVLRFKSDKQLSALHTTQKPVTLLEYLIRTYTREGETVLDFCAGSGSTGVACINTGRVFLGCEPDKDIFLTANDRLAKLLKAGGDRQ